MSILDTLVTDRTEEDVQLLKQLQQIPWSSMSPEQQAAWSKGSAAKGSYGVEDLNRVGLAMNYVASWFQRLGYNVRINPKIDWSASDVVTVAESNRYLESLQILRNAFATLQDTPDAPDTLDRLTVQSANDIEKILINIGLVLSRIDFGQYRSNAFMFYAGQMPFPSFYDQYLLADKDHFLLRTSDGKFLMVW